MQAGCVVYRVDIEDTEKRAIVKSCSFLRFFVEIEFGNRYDKTMTCDRHHAKNDAGQQAAAA